MHDPESGWVTLGTGAESMPRSALLTSDLNVVLRPWLAELRCLVVSNWEAPVTVYTRFELAGVAQQCVTE